MASGVSQMRVPCWIVVRGNEKETNHLRVTLDLAHMPLSPLQVNMERRFLQKHDGLLGSMLTRPFFRSWTVVTFGVRAF